MVTWIRGSGAFVALFLLLAGCSTGSSPKPDGAVDFEKSMAALSAPLDLQDYRVVNAEGHRGVFLKLSRLPDSVEDHAEEHPARIVIDIKGPTGTESPEEAFPGQDILVSHVRVERRFGLLRVTLDLQGDDVPPYSVHRMADWIMVRIGAEKKSPFSRS